MRRPKLLPALLALAVPALLICASGGDAGADKRATNPPRNINAKRKTPSHGKYTLRLSRVNATRVRLSRAALLAATSRPRRHKLGAISRDRALRYAGISVGVLLMAAAGIGWARRRGGNLARVLPPTLVALTLLVGGALYARHVEANRAPVRRWNRTTHGQFRIEPAGWSGPVTVYLPRKDLKRSCARLGYRR